MPRAPVTGKAQGTSVSAKCEYLTQSDTARKSAAANPYTPAAAEHLAPNNMPATSPLSPPR